MGKTMPYTINRQYGIFAIYKDDVKVKCYITYEEARDECYRLNGEWIKEQNRINRFNNR